MPCFPKLKLLDSLIEKNNCWVSSIWLGIWVSDTSRSISKGILVIIFHELLSQSQHLTYKKCWCRANNLSSTQTIFGKRGKATCRWMLSNAICLLVRHMLQHSSFLAHPHQQWKLSRKHELHRRTFLAFEGQLSWTTCLYTGHICQLSQEAFPSARREPSRK